MAAGAFVNLTIARTGNRQNGAARRVFSPAASRARLPSCHFQLFSRASMRFERLPIAASRACIFSCCSDGGRGDHGHSVRHPAIFAKFRNIIEEGEELIVVALRDGIEFVIVAMRAFERQSQPSHAERSHAIGYVLDAVLFFDNAAFGIDDVVASKTCGNPLIERRVRKQVARQLFGEKAIVWACCR